MFTIGIKGKGYYNGIARSGSSTTVETQRQNSGDYRIEEISDSSYLERRSDITIKIPMKRDVDMVDSKYVFTTRAEAEAELLLVESRLNREDKDRIYNNSSKTDSRHYYGNRDAQSSQTYYHKEPALKIFPQLVIIEEEVHIKKRSRFNFKDYTVGIAVASTNSGTCGFCNVEISKDEPHYRNYNFNVCNNCIQSMANELGTKYDACENAEGWTTAWVAEKLTREI